MGIAERVFTTGKHRNRAATISPVGHQLVPRDSDFDFDSVTDRHWIGSVFMTRFFDAMQLAFPDGERMFIQSVRNYRDKIDDPELQEKIKQFIYQEAQHGKAHTDFTEKLEEQGINVKFMVGTIKFMILNFQKFAPHKIQLAGTVAAEHFTATLGEDVLNHDADYFKNADPVMRAFYIWHAMEEVEHKSVAFEVYKEATDGDWITLAVVMAVTIPCFAVLLGFTIPQMLLADGKLLDRKTWLEGYRGLFGRKGFFRRTAKPMMEFFKPDFHPWKSGYPKYFHEWLDAYEASGNITQASETVLGRVPA